MNLTNLFGKFQKSNRPLNTEKHWLVILVIFFVLNLFSIGWHLYFFWKIQTGEFFIGEKTPVVSVNTIDRAVLEETLEFYRLKDERLRSFLNAPIQSVDPSR